MNLLGTYKIRNNATGRLEGRVIRGLKAGRRKRDALNVKAITKGRNKLLLERDREQLLSNPNLWPYCLARMV